MRLFIAAKIDDDLRKELAEFLDQFLQFPGKVKWVEPHNMHLTLKFLGETDPAKLEDVKSAARTAAQGFGGFDVALSGCGVFPNFRQPRVFWVGIVDEEKRLTKLASQVDNNVSQLGFEKEARPFSAHLTLGRVKDPYGMDMLKDAYRQAQFPPQPLAVKAIYLIESHLKPSGPVYKDLAEFGL